MWVKKGKLTLQIANIEFVTSNIIIMINTKALSYINNQREPTNGTHKQAGRLRVHTIHTYISKVKVETWGLIT